MQRNGPRHPAQPKVGRELLIHDCFPWMVTGLRSVGTSHPCGAMMMIIDPETFPLLSHLLLTHILLRGGIPRTFLLRHESVQSIPTYSFSVRYAAREKPNDLLESPAATGIPVRASAGQTPLSSGGGGSWPGLRSPPPEPGGGNPLAQLPGRGGPRGGDGGRGRAAEGRSPRGSSPRRTLEERRSGGAPTRPKLVRGGGRGGAGWAGAAAAPGRRRRGCCCRCCWRWPAPARPRAPRSTRPLTR